MLRLHSPTRLPLTAALFAFGLLARLPAQAPSLTDLLTQATTATQRGDLAQGETLFRRATEQAPGFSDAWLGLGLVELRRGELDASIASLQHAVELNPKLVGAHLFLGIAQYQVGQAEQARRSLEAELALDPGSPEALRWLGIVTLELGHPEDAVVPLDRLAALRPNDPQVLFYLAKAHQAVAKNALGRLYALDPDAALVHRALAESLDESGESEKSVAEFQAALRKDPHNPDLLEELGNEYQKLSRFDDATAAYTEELSLHPDSAIALYDLGRIDVERGKPADGVALLRKAEAAHASPSPTAFYLGLGLAELGQNAEAAHWLELSLTGQPAGFVRQGAWYQLARVYAKLNRPADAKNALAQLKLVLDAQAQAKAATARAARAQSPAPSSAPATPRASSAAQPPSEHP